MEAVKMYGSHKTKVYSITLSNIVWYHSAILKKIVSELFPPLYCTGKAKKKKKYKKTPKNP
jgi:hypothetical protein